MNLDHLFRWMKSLSRVAAFGVSCLLLMLSFSLDLWFDSTGHISFIEIERGLYFFPVAFAAYAGGFRVGMVIMVMSLLGVNFSSAHHIKVMYGDAWPDVIGGITILESFTLGISVILTSSLRAYSDRILLLTTHDPLTSVFNVRTFESELARELERLGREATHGPLSIVFVDVDDFKVVNDVHGHRVGDQALVSLGSVLMNAVRRVDTVARVGGDEFAILLPHTDREEAVIVVERIQQSCKHILPISLSLSVGVAVFDKPPVSADAAVRMADQAMYEAKSNGKARFHVSSH